MKKLRSSVLMVSVFCILAGSSADLLLPSGLSAEERQEAGSPAAPGSTEEEQIEQRLEELEKAKAAHEEATEAITEEQEKLEQRVEELEATQTAQEDATRAIIRDAMSTVGSKINEYVTLGGTLEVRAGWGEDFEGQSEGVILLDTAELDLEIQVNDWTLGSMILEYDDGTDARFPTTEDFELAVDRVNIDTAYFTIGNPQRFPPFGTFGRIIVPFGISTGDPVADVLTLDDPLTLDVFEMRRTALGFGLGFPTPALTPAPPPVFPPPVKPLVINPLISSLSRRLGYNPRAIPALPTPSTPMPAPPLFNAGVYFYDGETFEGVDRGVSPGNHIGATAGFRTQGHCGRPYEQRMTEGGINLPEAFCPWSIDVDVDFNTSVFDSRFLAFEYRDFLGQIGFVPGMAASVKATLGPMSLVGEWNGAIEDASFLDDASRSVNMRPSAWQVSLGYQFDWNPWVEEIGAQGDYLAISYSESQDLAGVTRSVFGEPTTVGSAPRRIFLVSLGEWVLDGVRVAVEYSYSVDYSKKDGGTGKAANGVFTMLTLVW